MRRICQVILTMPVVLLLAGCVSASRHKQEMETVEYQKWQAEQKSEKLESDLVLQRRQIETILKDRRSQDWELPVSRPPASRARENPLSTRLASKGLETVSHDGHTAVIISGLFETGSSTLSAEAKKRLKKAAGVIKSESPKAFFRIDGYTDNAGASKSNGALSLKRSQAVKDFLASECGFSAKRITARGLGEKNPVADNKTKEGRKQNRRIEIVIIK